jgi:hypothetical protein
VNAYAQDNQLPASPYPGIEPFDYAHRMVLFARETEARTLIQFLIMYRGVLLYSGSGTGKSSLINAGLIPLAIAEGYQPERIRVQPKRQAEMIVEQLSEGADGQPPLSPLAFRAGRETDSYSSVGRGILGNTAPAEWNCAPALNLRSI